MNHVYYILLVAIFIGCMAFLYPDGLWNNAIRLINVVLAAMLAFAFWEPLANLGYEYMASYTYFLDYLSLWIIFVAAFSVLRAVTDQISKVQVRFLKIVDRIGSGLLSVAITFVLLSFFLATLHTAPLPRNAFNGAFTPEDRLAASFALDVYWLGFEQQASRGVYARSASETDPDEYVFDRFGHFVPKYARRRADLEDMVNQSGELWANSGYGQHF